MDSACCGLCLPQVQPAVDAEPAGGEVSLYLTIFFPFSRWPSAPLWCQLDSRKGRARDAGPKSSAMRGMVIGVAWNTYRSSALYASTLMTTCFLRAPLGPNSSFCAACHVILRGWMHAFRITGELIQSPRTRTLLTSFLISTRF